MLKDFAEIIAAVNASQGIRKIAMTTNVYWLASEAGRWRHAGLTDINVSIDSLDACQFQRITCQDRFVQVLSGIDA